MSAVTVTPMDQWWHLEHSIQVARRALDPKNLSSFADLRAEICHAEAYYHVALMDGCVVGFGGFKKTGINRRVYEIPWCVVHPEYQKHGIGRLLTERAIEDVRERGGKIIFLSTPSPEFYSRFGFRLIDHIPGMWAAHIMSLRLP